MFDRTPVVNKDEMFDRLFVERQALEKSGIPIKTILNYWSDTTYECHCFPVFKADKPLDIINRYSDTFPMEYKALVQEVKDLNSNLLNTNGMSKEKTNMAKLRIPILVYRAMMEMSETFWEEGGMKWMEQTIKPLRIGDRGTD